jgi:ribosomal RNA-processing protein 17
MFAVPRPKKSILPPLKKRRKNTSAIEEINFDFDAREEFLTGFHKRKVERAKRAQAEAAKTAKEERIVARKEVVSTREVVVTSLTHIAAGESEKGT